MEAKRKYTLSIVVPVAFILFGLTALTLKHRSFMMYPELWAIEISKSLVMLGILAWSVITDEPRQFLLAGVVSILGDMMLSSL